jgi:hypothetical protein
VNARVLEIVVAPINVTAGVAEELKVVTGAAKEN